MVHLGLDYGEKRIGIARSDETGLIAEPLGFIENAGRAKVKQAILSVIHDTHAAKIVVGLPKTTKNELAKQATYVLQFVEKLKQDVPCAVMTWDERYSSQSADRILRDTEVALSKRREKRDALAAQVMLQNYLDFERIRSSNVSIDQAE